MPTEKEMLYSDAAYDAPIVEATPKSALYSDAGYSFTPQAQSAYQAAISKWRQTLNDFDIAVARLRMQAADPAVQADPGLTAQAQALLARAESLGPTIAAIRASVDDVLNAVSGAWDSVSNAWESAASWVGLQGLPREAGGLGALPVLIPLAAILAAVALISAFLVDYAKFSKQADLASQRGKVYAAAIAQGKTPADALAIAQGTVPDVKDAGFFSVSMGGVPWWVWLAAGGAVWYFFLRKGR